MDLQKLQKEKMIRRLVESARLADRSGCLELLELGAEPNGVCIVSGETALIAASSVGALGCVNALLDHGADAKVPGAHGVTPLMAASARGSEYVVSALLGRSDPLARSADKDTAFLLAVKSAHIRCADLLWDVSDKGVADSWGETALMAACVDGNELLALRLLPYANPLARDSMNRTAADHAQEAGLGNFAARLRALEEADALEQSVKAAPAARSRLPGL